MQVNFSIDPDDHVLWDKLRLSVGLKNPFSKKQTPKDGKSLSLAESRKHFSENLALMRSSSSSDETSPFGPACTFPLCLQKLPPRLQFSRVPRHQNAGKRRRNPPQCQHRLTRHSGTHSTVAVPRSIPQEQLIITGEVDALIYSDSQRPQHQLKAGTQFPLAPPPSPHRGRTGQEGVTGANAASQRVAKKGAMFSFEGSASLQMLRRHVPAGCVWPGSFVDKKGYSLSPDRGTLQKA